MSAPAGWHLQPDGQERYWDGTAWTDQFRAPLPSDPTAPPPLPSWAASTDETQALDVNSTQAIPAPAAPEQPTPPGYTYPAAGAGAAPAGYPQPTYPQDTYPQPGYPQSPQPGYPQSPQPGYPQSPQPGYPQTPQTGYGAPGGQPYAPPPRQRNGLAIGCLVAALIGVLVLGAVVVGGIYVFNRASDTISDTFPSGFPSDLPSEGLGQSIDITVGDGFDLPRATVAPGWSLEAAAGTSIVNITGMKADLTTADQYPVLFTMSFTDASGSQAETLCTAPSGASGATVDVTCVPLFGDVAGATRATVTASL